LQQIEITQLTTNGKLESAAISRDGKWIAYVTGCDPSISTGTSNPCQCIDVASGSGCRR
jgi:hypothetical protein